jgi:putative transposase
MSRKERRSIRIPGHDYSRPGIYFVTICSHKKGCLFGEVRECHVHLTPLGRLVRSRWMKIPHHYSHVSIDTYVVMPNHLHGILAIQNVGRGTIYRAPTEGFGKPAWGSIPTIIRVFKAAVTRQWRNVCKDPNFTVWQRNYYEHIVQDDRDWNWIRQYIADNPLRWELDPYHCE